MADVTVQHHADEPAPLSVASRRRARAAAWVDAGVDVDVAGRAVGGGMVYVGGSLRSARGLELEPSLIVWHYPVDWDHPDWTGETMPAYFPSYARLSGEARAAYLGWLDSGRRHKVHVGYPFMFLYGIERRLLIDLGCRFDVGEVDGLIAEVDRLRGVYGANRSFDGYTRRLVDFVSAARGIEAGADPPVWRSGMPDGPLPLRLRAGVGRYVSRGEAVPVRWALSYLRFHPGRPRRASAEVLPEHFDDMFSSRYEQSHGEGITLAMHSPPLRLSYTPANGGFPGPVVVDVAIPDVMSSPDLLDKLDDVAGQCCAELDPYRRYIARHPERSSSGDAVSLLPPDLLVREGGDVIAGLRAWSDAALGGETTGVASCVPLAEVWHQGSAGDVALGWRSVDAAVGLLARVGVGVEPDEDGPAWMTDTGVDLVLYRLVEGVAVEDHGGSAYGEAVTVADMAAQVVAPSGPLSAADQAALVAEVGALFDLSAPCRVRLRAHVAFAALSGANTAGVQPLRRRNVSGRQRAAVLLVDFAARHGPPPPPVAANLSEAFRRLDADESDLYSGLHAAYTRDGAADGAEPSTVGGTPLDEARVRARVAETEQVAAMLDSIFDDEDSDDGDTLVPAGSPPAAPLVGGDRLWGLDEAHAALAVAVAAQATWGREDLVDLAARLGLAFLDGALDKINDAALDACGEMLADGDGPYDVNEHAARAAL